MEMSSFMSSADVQEARGETGEVKTGERSLLTVLDILLRWRRLIIFNVLAVALVSVVISLLLPKWYKAKASLLPPNEKDVLSSFGVAGSLLRGIGGGSSMRALGGGQSGYNFFAILNSRTAMEAVVRRFNLVTVYEVKDSSMEQAIRELALNVSFEEGNNEDITIEVIDKDPRRAADMANYFVDILNEMSARLGTQEARNNREFIEKQVEKVQAQLRDAEDSLQSYQERAGAFISPDQVGALAPVAELYGIKAKKEVELSILRRTISVDNAEIRQKEIELRELGKKLSSFPGIGIQSVRLYRDVLIHQKILEYLLPLLEQAKVDEQKDIPVLLILDRAVAPERKFRPQRSLIVFFASSLALLASIGIALLFHGLRNASYESPFGVSAQRLAMRTARLYGVA
jgi:uncharacterized protein involved in exopolysaccharide biosynthesis